MKNSVRIARDEHGIPHIEARDPAGLYWGLGYVHATDRPLQMLLTRIAGQGRVSELLDGSDSSLEIDLFFRRMNWQVCTPAQRDALSAEAFEACEAYCNGVQAALSRRTPWELKLLGYRPEPWTVEDIFLMVRMLGYITLAQSQGEIERLFVEMVQAGVSQEKLGELFPGILGGLDMGLLRQVNLGRRTVPQVLWGSGVPIPIASNNWVVSGSRTASGKPILSNDPHLEVNRVPSVWCEVVLRSRGRYAMGGSMPGLPGVLVGRTPDIAWGATYAFMDAEDSWVERCKDGRFFREGDGWIPFRVRKERILRKGREAAEVFFYENDHGVLDGDPGKEGLYLSTRWAASESGAATINHIFRMWNCRDVAEGMDLLGRAEAAFNFVLADRHGNIGYQMSGLFPKRREGVSGFVPLAGWLRENDWQGFAEPQELPRCLNPEQGFFATANEDLNRYGRVKPINMPMGPYRAERIALLIRERDRPLTVEDMFRMHKDVSSTQAERFMRVLRPLLPETPAARILAEWDLRYDAGSRGATLFEAFYKALHKEVFARQGLGEAALDFLERETGTFADFYFNFDRVLLAEQSVWFSGAPREEIYRKAAAAALTVRPTPWGETRKVMLSHILFGGKLPSWLGFDRGPVTIPGSRATVHQGQIYRSGGRTTTFCPSYRFVTDLSRDEARTNLAGGPSDRRFSRWYCSDLKNWIRGRYKTLRPEGAQGGFTSFRIAKF